MPLKSMHSESKDGHYSILEEHLARIFQPSLLLKVVLTYRTDQLPVSLLLESVARSLHRYRRSRWSESRTGLNFSQGLFSLLLEQCSLLLRSLSISFLKLQFTYIQFSYFHSQCTISLVLQMHLMRCSQFLHAKSIHPNFCLTNFLIRHSFYEELLH